MKVAFKPFFIKAIQKIRDTHFKSDIDHRKDVHKHLP
jgi:hypothetical protein